MSYLKIKIDERAIRKDVMSQNRIYQIILKFNPNSCAFYKLKYLTIYQKLAKHK